MKKLKRILSKLLVITLLCGSIDLTVLAANETSTDTGNVGTDLVPSSDGGTPVGGPQILVTLQYAPNSVTVAGQEKIAAHNAAGITPRWDE